MTTVAGPWDSVDNRTLEPPGDDKHPVKSVRAFQHMQDEWTKPISGGRLVKFTYSELPEGEAFLTAQIAGHEVVYSVLLSEAEHPFSREGVERHFVYELRPISN